VFVIKFHQYQQNKQSPLILIEHKKYNVIYVVGNTGPGLGQAQKYGSVKPVNGISNLPLLITGWTTAIHI